MTNQATKSSILSTSGNQTLFWLIRGVFIESIRRREIYVVMLFMGLFFLGALAARITGAESTAAAAFILNLGLSLAWYLSLIVALLMAARQFPDELEQRSLYPLLAKPVSRNQYITGKWLASSITGCMTAIILNVLALAAAPWPSESSYVLLIQGIALELVAILLVTALAICFSIRVPKVITIIAIGLLAFAWAPLVNSIRSRAGISRTAIDLLLSYIPDFGQLDLINSISAGSASLGAVDFFARVLAAVIFTMIALAAGMFLFEKKPL